MVTAQELKEQGNKAFSANQYTKAAKIYRDAIKLDATNPVLYSNRAQCFIKLGDYDRGLKDCNCGINLTPEPKLLIKLYYRKGIALKNLNELSKAEFCFNKVLQLEPHNSLANKELQEINQKLHQLKSDANPTLKCKSTSSSNSKVIPIQQVQVLPEQFGQLLKSTNSKPAMKPIDTTATNVSENVKNEIEELFSTKPNTPKANTPPTASKESESNKSTLPMAVLMALKSLPPAKKIPGYNFVLNMTVDDCESVFASSGVDVEFVDFLLEAGAFSVDNKTVDKWETKLLEILDTLSKYEGFSLALLMSNSSNISKIQRHIEHTSLQSTFLAYSRILKNA